MILGKGERRSPPCWMLPFRLAHPLCTCACPYSVPLTYVATSSLDPDDPANLVPFRQGRDCLRCPPSVRACASFGSLRPPHSTVHPTPGSYSWACTELDPSTQLTTLCPFVNGTIPAVGGRLVVPVGTFSTGKTYTLIVTAAKGSRNDTDSATVSVLPSSHGTPPTGSIT